MRSRCPITRRTALPAVLSLAVAVLARFASVLAIGTAVSARPPNIVVILTDDQGYADISFNPHHPEEVTAPNLDRLAEDAGL